MRLGEALRALADEDQRRTTASHVEEHILGEIRQLARRRRARVRRAAALAFVATVMAAVATMWLRQPGAPPIPVSVTREVTTAFLPLPYAAVPVSNGTIVRVKVPRTALTSFGLLSPDLADAASGLTVTADVIVGDDGLARAVRFVRQPILKEHTR